MIKHPVTTWISSKLRLPLGYVKPRVLSPLVLYTGAATSFPLSKPPTGAGVLPAHFDHAGSMFIPKYQLLVHVKPRLPAVLVVSLFFFLHAAPILCGPNAHSPPPVVVLVVSLFPPETGIQCKALFPWGWPAVGAAGSFLALMGVLLLFAQTIPYAVRNVDG